MAEKDNYPKQERKTVDNSEALAEIADKQHEVIKETLEQAEKRHKDSQSERDALHEAAELAQKNEDEAKLKESSEQPSERHRGAPSKKQLKDSFKGQMKGVQKDLKPGGRLLSKLLHSEPVEKTSDFIGTTLARPNAMLSGSICAFAAITILYFVARYYGYQLSGFETIAAFIVGWLLGILYDYISVAIRKR